MTDRARSYGSVAEAFERGRPDYPVEAAAWLAGTQPTTVLEVGAGTGKLTRQLVALGHDVLATEPDEAMLEVLRRELPDVRTACCPAEALKVADRSVDVVVASQSFHWFDASKALAEAARVLGPKGRLGLVWNLRDERIPWVKRMGRLLDADQPAADTGGSVEKVITCGRFGLVEDRSFSFWHGIDRSTVEDLALSHSSIAALPATERERRVAAVRAFYDDFGRGMDGMQLPYNAVCYRTTVLDRPEPAAPRDETTDPETRERLVVTTGSLPRIENEVAKAPRTLTDDDGLLLIDFR